MVQINASGFRPYLIGNCQLLWQSDQISVSVAIAAVVVLEAVVSVEHEVQSERDVEERADDLVVANNAPEHVHEDNPVPVAEEVGVEAGFLDASWAIPVGGAKDSAPEAVEVDENLEEGSDHQPAGGHVGQAVACRGRAVEVALEPEMSEDSVSFHVLHVWVSLFENCLPRLELTLEEKRAETNEVDQDALIGYIDLVDLTQFR